MFDSLLKKDASWVLLHIYYVSKDKMLLEFSYN